MILKSNELNDPDINGFFVEIEMLYILLNKNQSDN